MAQQIIFYTGGVRSGKSGHALDRALELAGDGQPVAYVATSAVTLDDPDHARRIELHRQSRPSHWITIEATTDLAAAVEDLSGQVNFVLIDSLTEWVSNILLDSGDPDAETFRDRAESLVRDAMSRFLAVLRDFDGVGIIVTGEVGSGVAPPTRLGNVFADLLGEVNRKTADISSAAYIVVSGIPIQIK